VSVPKLPRLKVYCVPNAIVRSGTPTSGELSVSGAANGESFFH